jgi:hypothetical protein
MNSLGFCPDLSVDVMASLKWLLLAFAVAALSGCSASGNGRYALGTPTAGDGAAHAARDKTEGPAHRSARILRPKDEMTVGSIEYRKPDPALKPYSKEWLAQRDALDREADAALSKKMTICRGCLPSPRELDLVARLPKNSIEATGSTRATQTVTDGGNAPVPRPVLSRELAPSAARQTVKKPGDVTLGAPGGLE